MHKKITKSVIIAMSVLALAGCSQKPSNGEVTVIEESNVAEFKGDETSTYFINRPDGGGEEEEITKYVTSVVDGKAIVKSSILEDLFGFTPYEREADVATASEAESETEIENKTENLYVPTFKEFISPDNELLQCEIDGNTVIYNGTMYLMSNTIEEDSDGNVLLPLNDIGFAIGYSRVDTSRDGNSLHFDFIMDETEKETEYTFPADETEYPRASEEETTEVVSQSDETVEAEGAPTGQEVSNDETQE